MKIRLQRGSVRFRLRQGEALVLASTGRAEEPVWLGNAMFLNVLETHEGSASVTLDGAQLTARIPASDARRWQEGNEVGLYYTLAEGTRLLVEKDWACLEPRPGETNEDTFARPATPSAGCSGCVEGTRGVPNLA